jgi:hypothetical protein
MHVHFYCTSTRTHCSPETKPTVTDIIPTCVCRAYQLLHEAGDTQLNVTSDGPSYPPQGTCGAPHIGEDVWGGDVAPMVENVSVEECCAACIAIPECDVATHWTGENRCGLKKWAQRTNSTANEDRTSVNVTKVPPSNNALCSRNTGVLAVLNATAKVIDVFVYNHAAFADAIVDCAITVTLSSASVDSASTGTPTLADATVRRIDEGHANPLSAWIAMGAPDYTSAAQNAALLNASQLIVEPLARVASSVSGSSFTITVPTHGVAAVRVPLA